jgi:hypothetical protein
VIGYISAGSIQQKRVFIDNIQLPGAWQTTYPYDCLVDTALYVSKSKPPVDQVAQDLIPIPNANVICNAVYSPGGQSPIGYTYTDAECADCSVRGTLVKPGFWQ